MDQYDFDYRTMNNGAHVQAIIIEIRVCGPFSFKSNLSTIEVSCFFFWLSVILYCINTILQEYEKIKNVKFKFKGFLT